MSYRRSVILLCCLPAFICVWAQDARCDLVLTGTVLDEHDRTPLPYAEVYVPALERGVVADAEGRFSLSGLCPGQIRLRITHVGCDPVEQVVDIRKEKHVVIRLEHHVQELRVMEVERARPDENVGQAQHELDRATLERSSGRSLGEALATIPGVHVLMSGPTISKPVIHGLSGNRVLILNQGIRQEDQQWGTEHAPNLDPFSSDHITLVKGAASVQFGSDAMGGVIITEPVVLPRSAGLGGEVRAIGLLNGRGGGGQAMLQGGVKRINGLGWRLQGSARRLGDSEAPDYVLSNTGLREAGASATIGYRDHRWETSIYYSWFGRELGILRASHIGNLTDLANAVGSGTPWVIDDFTYAIDAPRQTARHHLLKAEAGLAISDRDRIVATYGYQADDRQEYDIRRGGRSAIPALDLFLTTHTGDIVLKHWLGPYVHGRVGVNGLYQENMNIAGTGVRPLIPDFERSTAGVFVLEHVPLGADLELEAGARLEGTVYDVVKYDADNALITPRHTYENHAWSVGGNWTVTDSVRLRVNISSAFRPPNMSELYSEGLHHGAAAIEVGDPDLTNERSLKAVIDLEATLCKGRLRTYVTIYADRIANYIYLIPDGTELTIRGAFPVFRYVSTNAQLLGGDLTLEYDLARGWAWQLRASTVHGRDMVKDEWLFQLPSDRVENVLVHAWHGRNGRNNYEAGLSGTVVFEQERVPVGLDYMSPPATYHLIGCSANAVLPVQGNELRIGLRGSNLLNNAYRDYMDRFRYYADARGLDIALWITYGFGHNRP